MNVPESTLKIRPCYCWWRWYVFKRFLHVWGYINLAHLLDCVLTCSSSAEIVVVSVIAGAVHSVAIYSHWASLPVCRSCDC